MTVLRTVGKFLISVGVGVLLFVAWTLWGTGLSTSRAQEALEAEFDAADPIRVAGQDDQPREPIDVPDSFRPGPGDPVFRMTIPRMDFRQVVVEGVDTDELKKGPGHYPDCREGFTKPLCTDAKEVWPGERGRAIVSGHRTTYGAPFWDLDRLREGDEISLETRWGDFTYEVTGTEVVLPNAKDIATPDTRRPELVLTTCNPRFSASERLVVFAEMEAAP
ncbi:MAG: sortase [Actinomycetota bacterium]|nr:sortase [Actinomycetota bacterium]